MDRHTDKDPKWPIPPQHVDEVEELDDEDLDDDEDVDDEEGEDEDLNAPR